MSTRHLTTAPQASPEKLLHLHRHASKTLQIKARPRDSPTFGHGCGQRGWVPEGSLAGFCWGAFLRSGRPRGPGKAFQKVGVLAPHLFEGLPGRPGPARPQKNTPKNPARLPAGTQTPDGGKYTVWAHAVWLPSLCRNITAVEHQLEGTGQAGSCKRKALNSNRTT